MSTFCFQMIQQIQQQKKSVCVFVGEREREEANVTKW